MFRQIALALTFALTACGYAESDYLQDEAAAACTFSVDCFPGLYTSVDECVALRGSSSPVAGCEFDPVAAKDCVEGLELMDCPADGEFPAFPEACDAVYLTCQEAA